MVVFPEATVPLVSRVPSDTSPSAAMLRERVRRLNSDLEPDSATARAALLLLAGLQLEHNVVKLSRFAGLDEEFVARCARRLVDNGVWRGGQTICEWNEEPNGDPAFWADVAVAEGKLCRRIDEQGRPQWAPGGHWWKSFDFVGQPQPEQSVLYRSPPPPAPAPVSEPWVSGDDEELEDGEADFLDRSDAATPDLAQNAPVAESDRRLFDARQEESSEPGPLTVGSSGGADAPPSDEQVREEPARSAALVPPLFPDAVWL